MLLRAELTRDRVSLRSEYQPVIFHGWSDDRVQLQQVLINLVMNGIEAMRSLAHQPRALLITSSAKHDEVSIFLVQDSGAGFGPQQAEHI